MSLGLLILVGVVFLSWNSINHYFMYRDMPEATTKTYTKCEDNMVRVFKKYKLFCPQNYSIKLLNEFSTGEKTQQIKFINDSFVDEIGHFPSITIEIEKSSISSKEEFYEWFNENNDIPDELEPPPCTSEGCPSPIGDYGLEEFTNELGEPVLKYHSQGVSGSSVISLVFRDLESGPTLIYVYDHSSHKGSYPEEVVLEILNSITDFDSIVSD